MATEDKSFHKFPINSILKQNWLIASGNSSISISSTISHENFSNNLQADGNENTRQLLSKVVFTITKNPNLSVNITNTITEPTTNDGINCGPEDKEQNSEMLPDVTSTVTVTSNKDEINNTPESVKERCTSEVFYITEIDDKPINKNDNNSRPQKSDNDTKMNRFSPYSIKDLMKEICFKDDKQTECSATENVVSDKAWDQFLVNYRNNQTAQIPVTCTQPISSQRKKKINNLSTIIEKLKTKASEASKY